MTEQVMSNLIGLLKEMHQAVDEVREEVTAARAEAQNAAQILANALDVLFEEVRGLATEPPKRNGFRKFFRRRPRAMDPSDVAAALNRLAESAKQAADAALSLTDTRIG